MKYLLGYLPWLAIVLFIYLPGLFDFFLNCIRAETADVIGGNKYFSSFIQIKFKLFNAGYYLSFNNLSFVCLSIGLLLLFVGLYTLKMNPPAGN